MIPTVLISLSGAALQAAGHTVVPLLSMLAGAAVKLGVESILLGIPAVGILGAPISTLCCGLTVLAIQAAVLSRVLPLPSSLLTAPTRALSAAVFAVGGGVLLYAVLGKWPLLSALQMPLTLVFCAALYALLILRFRAVADEDVLSLPCGEKLLEVLYKYHILQEVQNDERRKAQLDAE
jgi:stage V sporulation protein B